MKEETFLDRLKEEHTELNKKISKLEKFLINRDNHSKVSIYQLSLLRAQFSTMKTYSEILLMRIENLEGIK